VGTWRRSGHRHRRGPGCRFRWWCQAEAQQRHVRGWVSNRYDGSVDVWLEGDPQGVREMILWLHEVRAGRGARRQTPQGRPVRRPGVLHPLTVGQPSAVSASHRGSPAASWVACHHRGEPVRPSGSATRPITQQSSAQSSSAQSSSRSVNGTGRTVQTQARSEAGRSALDEAQDAAATGTSSRAGCSG